MNGRGRLRFSDLVCVTLNLMHSWYRCPHASSWLPHLGAARGHCFWASRAVKLPEAESRGCAFPSPSARVPLHVQHPPSETLCTLGKRETASHGCEWKSVSWGEALGSARH